MELEAALAKARESIGQEWGPTTLRIERHWVRAFVEAIEDPNPLWRNSRFARTTAWGSTVLPPTAVSALDSRFRIRLRPVTELQWGSGSVNAGLHYRLLKPIRVGDRISCRFRAADVVVKQGRIGPLVFLSKEHVMTNQRDETVVMGRQTSCTYEGSGLAESRPIPEPRRPERRANAAEGLFVETLRNGSQSELGPGPHFEDVKVGQELAPVSQGPVRTRSQVKWQASSEDYEEIHYDYVYCRQVGLPDVIAEGKWVYCSTIGRMLTDWLGTAGTLSVFSLQFRAPVYMGDFITGHGRVTAVSPTERAVEIETWVENQRGERNVVGMATARLPA